MKILHVITGLGNGGAEGMLLRLVAEGEGKSFTTKICTLTGELTKKPKFDALGVPVLSSNFKGGPLQIVRGILDLRAEVKRFDPDVVQSWLYHSDFFTFLALLFTPYRSRLIWSVRNSELSGMRLGLKSLLKILSLLSRFVPVVLYNSFEGERYHRKIGYRPKFSQVIHNGFDVKKFFPNSDLRSQLRKKFRISADTFVIGNISRFDNNKDFPTFFNVVAEFVRKKPSTFVILAGKGCTSDNEELNGLIASNGLTERVLRLGEVNDVNAVLNMFDVFLFTSRHEGFPNVVAEAALCEIPIVATACGDVGWILPQHTLSPIGDHKKLLAQLIAVTENSAIEPSYRDDIIRKFSIDSILTQFMDCYSKV